MSYFELLKPEIMAYMINFQNDFLEIDREELQNYHDQFLLSVRQTGTNLLKLERDYILSVSLPIFMNPAHKVTPNFSYFINLVPVYLFSNDLFFYGHNDLIERINKDKALIIFNKWLPSIKKILKTNLELQNEIDFKLSINAVK